jgi:hypothetical protein
MKKYSTCTVQYHVQFQGMTEQYKSCFSITALHKQWQTVLYLHILQRKSYIRTGILPVIRLIYLLKNILAYCGYSPTSPFFLLLSEHKHCDNATTNLNRKNARSRMVVSLRGSVGMGTKEEESSTGRVWAARFHHLTARSRMVQVLKLRKWNNLFL